MALKAKHNDIEFGVGDTVRVVQKIKEADKERKQAFEGMVIAIKGRDENKSFTVRRIGAQQVGIERIFPLETPIIEKIEVIRKGTKGSKRAKLYFTREKSKREIEKIYSRTKKKDKVVKKKIKKAKINKKKSTKKEAKKTSKSSKKNKKSSKKK
jgi:large subunit ribosomal protein L19